MERIIGKIEGDMPGPLVICVAGIHGNEQIGIHAFRNVYSTIQNHQIPFRGQFVGIAGNLKAIQSNKRYIDYDLNRCWTPKKVHAILTGQQNGHAEDSELIGVYEAISQAMEGSFTHRVMVDLHATSSDKGNFIVVTEEHKNHPIIEALKLPVIVDLHHYLEGTLLAYFNEQDFLSFVLEGGLIGSQEVYRMHTSGLWEILDKAGCISHHDHENEDHYSSQLETVSRAFPDQVKVAYCHRVIKGDGFKMLPGFHNFQPVHKGQQVALDLNGPILIQEDGLIFMPLYQSEGEDGFFVVKELS